jgi:hypothetical protein
MLSQLEVAHLVYMVNLVRIGPEYDLRPLTHHAVHYPDAGDGAPVAVVIGIKDEGTERCVELSAGWRYPSHQRFEQLGNAGSLLGRHRENLLPLRSDEIHDLLGSPLRLRTGKVDLIEHRDDLETGIHRQKEIA